MTTSLEERTTLWSQEETAERLRIATNTLANMRWRGEGPRFCKVGARVLYRPTDVAEYLDQRTRTSTSDDGSSV